MKVFNDISSLRSELNKCRQKGGKVGLVPTMGALHEGHLKLIEKSIEESDYTICSIYINPTQFNNNSDLEKYPRTLESDLKVLEEAGCDAVFIPSDEVMYPNDTLTKFSFGYLENIMEGKHRPGHFNGVATVVCKLFNIVDPDLAYFGQKDLQQFLIITNLVQDLSFNIELRCIDVVRDTDGLAKSSRNLRLSKEERKKSVILHQTLQRAKSRLFSGDNVTHCEQLAMREINAEGLDLEYFEIVDAETLKSISNINEPNHVAICVAAHLGEVRLIDNIIFNKRSEQ